jgi:flagellar FliL protein
MAVAAVKSEPAPAEEAPRAGGKKSIIKLALVALLVVGAAGGGAWWHFSHKDAEAAKEAKDVPPKPPVFFPLDTFTVNLQLVDNPQFLQTGITLKVADGATVEELKLHMPVVRDRILMLMSSRKAVDLLTVEGKRQLSDDIVTSMNQILGASASKSRPAAKAGDGKAAADDEEEKDGEDARDAKTAKGAPDDKADAKAEPRAEKAADNSERRVQAVLFTSFIIQ